MAYPEEVTPSIPETLPEDFSDWDGEASPTSLPGRSSEGEAAPALSETLRSRGQSNHRDAVRGSAPRTQRLWGSDPPAATFGRQQNEFTNWQREASPASLSGEALLEKPRDSWAASSAAAGAESQSLATAVVDESPAQASHAETNVAEDGERHLRSKMREADEAIYQLFAAKNVEVKPVRKPARNKWVMIAVVGVCSILLSFLLSMLLGHHGAKAAVNQPIQSFSGATATLATTNVAKPSAGEPVNQSKPSAPAASQPKTDDQQSQSEVDGAPAPSVTQTQTQMMNDQLNAPRMIPQGAAKQVAEDTPPPATFGAAGADLGGRGAMPVFNQRAQSVVAAPPPKPPVISSGVAIGMLVQKTPPLYPPIAKAARVSGIVELHATITRNGTIKDLYVVKGPEMLRQSAMDAVRNWRYKPYTLNNQAIDVETTINVAFTLGN